MKRFDAEELIEGDFSFLKMKEMEIMVEPYISFLEDPFLYNFGVLEKIYESILKRFSSKTVDLNDIKEIESDNQRGVENHINIIFDFLTLLDKKIGIGERPYLAYFKKFIEEKIATNKANKIQIDDLLPFYLDLPQLNEEIANLSEKWMKENESFLTNEAFLAFCACHKIREEGILLGNKNKEMSEYIEAHLKKALTRKKLHYKVALEKRSYISIEKCLLINKRENMLFLASKNGHEVMAELILSKDIHINAKDAKGETLFHLAARRGDILVVKLLFDKGANIREKNNKGLAPIHLASYNGHEAVAKFLLDKGVEIHTKDDYGRTPIHLSVEKGNVAMIALLLDKGANIKERRNEGFTFLHFATYFQNKAVMELLLNRGIKINAKDDRGWTSLHLAVGMEDIGVTEFLLDKGANMEEKDKSGWTVLCFAVKKGNFPMVKLLVDRGADVNAKANSRYTPMLIAAKIENKDIINYMMNQRKAEEFYQYFTDIGRKRGRGI